MGIQVPKGRKVDHPLRNDAPVAYDDDGVWPKLGELGPEILIVFDCVGLRDGELEPQCALLNWRRRQFHATTTRSVRLRHDQLNMKPVFNQFFERGYRESRRSSEDEVEGLRHRVVQLLPCLTTHRLSQV